MNKRVFLYLLTIFIFIFPSKTFAVEIGANVTVQIESFNKTLLIKNVTAPKFKNAIEKAIIDDKFEITYSQDGANSSIYSFNSIKDNSFNEKDGWNGYVKRGNIIIGQENYLNTELKNGDTVVLYYGKKDITQIVSDVEVRYEKGLVNFNVISKQVINNETISKPVKNVKIYFFSPNGSKRILVTNNTGKAVTKLDNLGVYEYYIADESSKKYPNVVKTESYLYLYGLEDDDSATRAEAISFLIRQTDLKKGTTEIKFTDLPESHKYFTDVNIAISNKIVNGYSDNTIKPDGKINLLQLSIILSQMLDDSTNAPVSPDTSKLPQWAKQSVSNILNENILKGIVLDWDKYISGNDLLMIFRNLSYNNPF